MGERRGAVRRGGTTRASSAQARRRQKVASLAFSLLAGAAVVVGVPVSALLATQSPAAAATSPEQAVLVPVSGSSLSAITTSPPSLSPSFSPSTTDYAMYCRSSQANSITLTLTAASGTIASGGQTGSTIKVQVQLDASQAAVVAAPDPDQAGATTQYWIRCLPPDFPVLQSVESSTEPPPSGWITTGNLDSIPGKSSGYAMVLDSNGTPVWWQHVPTVGVSDTEALPYSPNTLAWIDNGASNPSFEVHDLLTGSTQQVAVAGSPEGLGGEEPISPSNTDVHELLQLSNGNYMLFATPVRSGVNLSPLGLGTDQSIDDCVIEELNSQGVSIWTWYASDHINPNESTRPVETNGVWDVYHCNAIDIDPNQPDPDVANVLLSMRNTDAVYLINRATNQVEWKVGHEPPLVPEPDGASPEWLQIEQDPETAFYGQHDARFEPNGDISLFDDHTGASGASRGVEYHIDTQAQTATMDFEYQQPEYDDQAYNTGFLGSFRRLAGGDDNIIGWGANSSPTHLAASEVDASGNQMLTLTFPNGEFAYRMLKVAPTLLDATVLHQAMGGLPPAVSSISASGGPSVGGTPVTIQGSGFTQASKVSFGSTPATSFTVNSDSSISAIAPPGTGSVDVKVTTPSGTSAATGADVFTYTPGSGPYHPLTPYRILDTRTPLGGHQGPLGQGASMNLQVTGTGSGPDSVPAGATAVVLNVTEADASNPSYLTVWPSGQARPTASNLNFGPTGVVPNLVEVGLPASGMVSIYNAVGNTDVVADVEGYVTAGSSGAGLFEPLSPARVLDTRTETGGHQGPLGASQTLDLQATGAGQVPATGVSAVVLNVTVTDTTAPSYLTVWPAGAAQPLTSNLNFGPGQTVPNRVIVPVGVGGQVSIYNAAGSANVVADVGGWFTDGSDQSETGAVFTPAPTPTRVLDTRSGPGPTGPITQGSSRQVDLAGSQAIPQSASSVVANETVTDTTAPSYLTVYPGTESQVPSVSDLNWSPGQTIANLGVTEVGSDGSWKAYNQAGSTDLVLDVEGWYAPAS